MTGWIISGFESARTALYPPQNNPCGPQAATKGYDLRHLASLRTKINVKLMYYVITVHIGHQ